MIQLRYTESFIAGTGCNSPEEVILKGLKGVQDWCDHLTKWGKTADAIGVDSPVMQAKKFNTRVKREVFDKKILETIKRLSVELGRGCTVLELVAAFEGEGILRLEKRVREGIEELFCVGLIDAVEVKIEGKPKHTKAFVAVEILEEAA